MVSFPRQNRSDAASIAARWAGAHAAVAASRLGIRVKSVEDQACNPRNATYARADPRALADADFVAAARTITYDHDQAGNRLTLLYDASGASSLSLAYQYDELSQNSKVQARFAMVGGTRFPLTVSAATVSPGPRASGSTRWYPSDARAVRCRWSRVARR